DPTQVSLHQDIEITNERVKFLKRYFLAEEEMRKVNTKFANFSDGRGMLHSRYKSLWLIHGGKVKLLQPIAL
ncbi:hypothetical protein S245_005652, partial [Arachis hypogaea]